MAASSGIRIKVDSGFKSAVVAIPEGISTDDVCPEVLQRLAAEEGIELLEEHLERLKEIAARYAESGSKAIEEEFAKAVLPQHGDDARLEWVDGFDPTAIKDDPAPAHSGADDQDNRVDHYRGPTFIRVAQGDHVATIRKQTEGTDGTDLKGNKLKAKSGKPLSVTIDGTFEVRDDNTVVARESGVLRLDKNILRVCSMLEIPGYVDFSTGHVEYAGCVAVREGVRDRFKVDATEDIEIGGLIEAATIICRRDFRAARGMAAKDRGQLVVGGNAEIGFMNNVRALIDGSLHVRREIINCETVVGGNVAAERGKMIGGILIAGGKVALCTLGSEAYAPTTVCLAEVPVLARKAKRLEARIAEYENQAEQARTELDETRKFRSQTSQTEDRIRSLESRLAQLRDSTEQARARLESLNARIESQRNVDLRVDAAVHPKVCLRILEQDYEFHKHVKGPIHIGWAKNRHPWYRIGDGPRHPIEDVARPLRTRRAA